MQLTESIRPLIEFQNSLESLKSTHSNVQAYTVCTVEYVLLDGLFHIIIKLKFIQTADMNIIQLDTSYPVNCLKYQYIPIN